ncbi:unnamed protein product, partial [Meganyctiphanes norvegica]
MMLMELGAGGGGVLMQQEAVGGVTLSHNPSGASTSRDSGGGSIRFVRLLRRRGETYGFSLRGGKEHGTGFFISHVEPGSEAYHNGLRAGDQVLRVNNLCVEQAVHREVAAMVQAKNSVILKVRSTGIIPIKENRGDPLTWMVVDEDEEFSDNGTETYSHSLPSTSMPETDTDSFQQSPTSTATDSFHQSQSSTSTNESHARIFITYNAKTGLGCSICKGPPEKNGIFVQSVRGGGVAKEAGLRPGDQILACNDVSFQHLEFAEAVYVLKSSTHLTLDVLRGAGLDLVAGESSGYNSSASSVAGDQTPPSATSSGSSDISHKELHHRSNSHDSVASRLTAVSRHLTLDRTRGWREIEAEWANAEAEQKRQQLQQSQKNLKTRAQRDAAIRSGSRISGTSRSMSNLLIQEEEDEEEETTAFRDAPYAAMTLQRNKYVGNKSSLRSAVSTSDLRSDHKIALVTSADPHVNNIVITQGPKDEKDAVSRLEQLSSPSTDSRNSTVSSSASQVTVRSSLGDLKFGTHNSIGSLNPQVEVQLRELREEQRRLQLEADRLAEDRRRFEEERRGLQRTQSVPLSPTFSPTTPLLINCSTPPSSLSQPPPSPTPSTASGRHTTRVIIKSAPPPPPPRNNKTSLTSTLTRRGHYHHRPSPPASPSHSNSSSGVGSSCGSGGPPPRRCKSIGSLSASSGESSLWEESSTHPSAHQFSSTLSPNYKAQYSTSFRPSMHPPPPPPKPASSSIITPSPQAAGGVPPPPPPPPQTPPAAATPSLANALLREIVNRGQQQDTSGTLNATDATARAQKLEDKIDSYKKERSNETSIDPKKARHDQLMEEFKLAHKRMFKDPLEGKEQNSTAVNTSQIFSKANLKPVTPKTSQTEQTSPAVSKIINNNDSAKVEQTTPVISKIINNSKIANSPTTATKVVNQVVVNGENKKTENNFNSKIVKSSSVNKTSNEKETIIITSLDKKVTIGSSTTKPALKQNKDITTSSNNNKSVISNGNESMPSVLKLSQQWNERSGGTNISVSSITASTRPGVTSTSSSVLPGSTVVEMNEFRPSVSSQPAKPKTPNTYFEVKPKSSNNSSKPLVSINVYPSAMQRPSPNKMDFLPTSSHNTDIKTNGNVSNISKSLNLQSELTSTLNRSPLRQRLTPQNLPEDQPTSTGTSATNGNILYLYSTSAINDIHYTIPFENSYESSATPSTTLSSKYSCLGSDISSFTIINNVEEGYREGYRDGPPDALAESPPAGILKQALRPTQHKPLHKSISFGDVTTVGDDEQS